MITFNCGLGLGINNRAEIDWNVSNWFFKALNNDKRWTVGEDDRVKCERDHIIRFDFGTEYRMESRFDCALAGNNECPTIQNSKSILINVNHWTEYHLVHCRNNIFETRENVRRWICPVSRPKIHYVTPRCYYCWQCKPFNQSS